MSDFSNRLRMNNIFPTGDDNPFGPTATPNQGINLDEISGLINRIAPVLQAHQERGFAHQKEMMGMQQPQLKNIGSQIAGVQPQKPMGTAYNPGISDFQRAGLNLKRDELNQKKSLAESGLEIKRDDQGIRQQRADIYDYKAKNPNLKFVVGKNGNFFTQDPATGEMRDTGHSSDKMPEAEKLKITGEQRMSEINAKQSGAEKLQGIKGGQQLANIGARVSGQQATDANKISLTNDKPIAPTQERVQQNNAARELMTSRPDLAPFIKIDDKGGFTVDQPGTSFFGSPTGPNAAQAKEITDHIYNSKPAKMPAKVAGNKVTVNDGAVKMRTEDGREVMIPADKVDEALKRKAVRVK